MAKKEKRPEPYATKKRARYDTSVKKLKSEKPKAVRFSKARFKNRIVLTNVIEYESYDSLYGKRGILQIRFRFTKGKKSKSSTGRSDAHLFPRDYKIAFDECYQRALAQITFSPDYVSVERKTYFYWIERKRVKK